MRPQRERTPAEGQTDSKHLLELVHSVGAGRCMQKAARRHSVLTRCSALRDLVMHSLLSTSRHQQERQQEPRLPLPRTHSHPCCTACCVSPWQAFKRVALAWEAGSVHASAWRAARTCAAVDVIVLLEFSPLDPPEVAKFGRSSLDFVLRSIHLSVSSRNPPKAWFATHRSP